MTYQDTLQSWFDARRREYGVVGASLALFSKGELESTAAGVLNLDTGVPVSTGSLFQIGSISKVFTATLVMQLVDEGRLDLDCPVQRYLPGFAIADADASRLITVRQLLCHTSGMEGDFFPDDPRWSGAVSRYVEQCRLLPQLHPVGAYFSYCNSGFTVAGLLVELLTGQPWHVAVRERIFRPLGMAEAVCDPAELPRYSAAIGHVPRQDDAALSMVADRCFLPPGLGPAGAVLMMSATDLMRFACCHLYDGKVAPGDSVLSARSVQEMRQAQLQLPAHFPLGATAWGLGWYLGETAGRRMFGHNGGTIGQFAYLHVYPEHEFAICLLSNSRSAAFFSRIEEELLSQRLDIQPHPAPACAVQPRDFPPYCGRYQNLGGTLQISDRQGTLHADFHSEIGDRLASPLQALGDHCFITGGSDQQPGLTLHFLGLDGGEAAYVLAGSRLLRRVDGTGVANKEGVPDA